MAQQIDLPAALAKFGSNPLAAVIGLVKKEHTKWKTAVRRAAKRLNVSEETRVVNNKKYYVLYNIDTGDGVNETAAKVLMLLQRNPAAVGDEILRTWAGKPIGSWSADTNTSWPDYLLDLQKKPREL